MKDTALQDVPVQNPNRTSAAARALTVVSRTMIRPAGELVPVTAASMPVASTVINTLAKFRPAPRGVEREQVRLNGFRMEIVRPAGARKSLRDGAVLYMHGGGFFLCGLDTHRPVVAALARRTGLPVVSVEYRQLPETDIAGSVTDCLTAYKWLLAHGVPASRVVFAGDSAGGYMTFATALRARDAGLPVPAGLVGLCPALDLDCTEKRNHPNYHRDALIPLSALESVVKMGAEVDGHLDPRLSPVNHVLAGMPPALLIVAEDEVLRRDSEIMAHRLAQSGVPAPLEIWRGQVHAFMAIFPNMPESRAALASVSRFVRDRIAAERIARTA
ncbi:alpha/beta hydrolase [Nocardia seriolae]|uniref:alpha/beta hydrolase n=1 Tax=Nocardia seriolae TaxID=37332 RepID=UPI00090C74E3|nr:alpha/beta hydrolase [Nocardia seriolae]WKY52479.1 alpha/beta hydrolase [Nocardia seriolae]WNJ59480.1 alpha/beta hydrolase [Nocardia seriolae]BAW03455.1 esterase [Nocardia seriolae]